MRQKERRVRSKAYMAHVRGFPCLSCGGQAEAHHVKFAELRSMGMKPGDNWCVPLCHACHMSLHDFGREQVFWACLGIDPIEWARKHWERWNEQ
jgi:hypothetical protein